MMQIVGSERDFLALEGEWSQLASDTRASFFSSFDYVHTAWNCFAKPDDRLFILVSRREEKLVTLAPFIVTRDRIRKLPYRLVRFISAWEGECPGILTTLDKEAAWREIIDFLVGEGRNWDALDFVEQPVEGPAGNGWGFLEHPACYWEHTPDATGYDISLRTSWDDYLKGIDTKVKKNLRRSTRLLSNLPRGFSVESVSDPSEISAALARYIAVELSGWKKAAGIGVSKDDRHRTFYERLLLRLSKEGRALLYFLKSGKEDIASGIFFKHRRSLIFRHCSFSPDFARFSPGIILQAEIVKEHCDGGYDELDLMGIRDEKAGSRDKTDWATGKRETVWIKGYRVRSRLLPFILAKKMKRISRAT